MKDMDNIITWIAIHFTKIGQAVWLLKPLKVKHFLNGYITGNCIFFQNLLDIYQKSKPCKDVSRLPKFHNMQEAHISVGMNLV